MDGQRLAKDDLGELQKLGQGGQGIVYRAPKVRTKFADAMVFKEYKLQSRSTIDFVALAEMPHLVEQSLTYRQAEQLVAMAAWPCAIVEDQDEAVGFVMPAIPDQFTLPLTTVKGTSQVQAEFQHLLNHESVLVARGIDITDAQRYALLRAVAIDLSFLHGLDVCVGDISPKNMLFSLDPREAVYFIDCDAMRVKGTSAIPQAETPGWQVPDGEELATIQSDTYKLGLLALRLLVGDQDVADPIHLPSNTPNVLRKLITDTLTRSRDQRPLPEAWSYVLGHAVEEAQEQEAARPQAASGLPAPAVATVKKRPSPGSRSLTFATASVRPPIPPTTSPVQTAATKSSVPIQVWALGASAVAILAIVLLVIFVANGNGGESSAPTTARHSSTFSDSTEASADEATPITKATTATTQSTFRFAPPPDLVATPDAVGDSTCATGERLDGDLSLFVARGTDATTCNFAYNVGTAYVRAYSNSVSYEPRRINAGSSKITCPQKREQVPTASIECSGDLFVMYCAVQPGEMWVTCEGGYQAKVYIF